MSFEVPYQVAVAADAVAEDVVAVDDAVAVGGTGYSPRDSLTAPGGELRA